MFAINGSFWKVAAPAFSTLLALAATACAPGSTSEDVGTASSAGTAACDPITQCTGDAGCCVDPNNGSAMCNGQCTCGDDTYSCCENGEVTSTQSSCSVEDAGGGGADAGTGTVKKDAAVAPEDSGGGVGPGVGNASTFGIGMCGTDDGPSYAKFLAASSPQPHRCHIYTYWNIAQVADPPRPSGAPVATGSHDQSDLNTWFEGDAKKYCDEVLVTFQGAQEENPKTKDAVPETAPTHDQFTTAFTKFLSMFTTGKNASWSGKVSFTAWNEPNNKASGGNGLDVNLSPESAADYYLIAQNACNAPNSGCAKYKGVGLVAAGDFATNGDMGAYTKPDGDWSGSIALNCGADETLKNGGSECASYGPNNPDHWGPSYLDRYKAFIASNVGTYKYLGKSFRPAYWAYHPWHDVNSYIDSSAACQDYEHCTTRRLLASLSSSWGGAEIWQTEIGVGQQNDTLDSSSKPGIHSDQSGQIELQQSPEGHNDEGWVSVPKAQFRGQIKPCGEAFLAQLTDLSSRFSRIYYMFFGYSNSSLMESEDVQPPPLASMARTVDGAGCSATGFESTYSNPIIPMFSLVENEEREYVKDISPNPTEGCPDPQGMRTWDNHYYIYCTSYSLGDHRYGGFPIFKADSLSNNEWDRVGWIIPPKGGKAREEWPTWIKRDDGLFWGPDVHELTVNGHDHVYVALFAAPHEYKSHGEKSTYQSIGMAWSSSPTGPWQYYQGHPFISSCGSGDSDCTHSACDGTNSNDCDGDASAIKENGSCDTTNTYDPNLLVDGDHMYLYWAINGPGVGDGIMAQEVRLKSNDGELELVGTKATRVSTKGEGPYAFQHDDRTYLFYSTSDDGLDDDYHVNVLSSPDPVREVNFADRECGKIKVTDRWDVDPNPVIQKTKGIGWQNGHAVEVNSLAFSGTGGSSIIPDVNGTDMMVYHGIVVPQGPVDDIWCDDIENMSAADRISKTSHNPYCRSQGERQAMLDPISWISSSAGGVAWPVVNAMSSSPPNGVTRSAAQASTGPVPVP